MNKILQDVSDVSSTIFTLLALVAVVEVVALPLNVVADKVFDEGLYCKDEFTSLAWLPLVPSTKTGWYVASVLVAVTPIFVAFVAVAGGM